VLGTDGITTTVTHISHTQQLRVSPLDAHHYRGGPAVMGLDCIHIEKIPGQQRAANVATKYKPVLNIKLINDFTEHL
jgi:hypothetical protein